MVKFVAAKQGDQGAVAGFFQATVHFLMLYTVALLLELGLGQV